MSAGAKLRSVAVELARTEDDPDLFQYDGRVLGHSLSNVRHVVKCPGCGGHVVYHAPVFGPAIETTALANGEFRISALYTQHFGERKTYAVVLHECGQDGGSDGDDDPVPALPPRRPPSGIQSAQRDPGEN